MLLIMMTIMMMLMKMKIKMMIIIIIIIIIVSFITEWSSEKTSAMISLAPTARALYSFLSLSQALTTSWKDKLCASSSVSF